MTELDPVVRQRLVLRADRGPESPTPACLDDHAIAALAEGSLTPERHAAALPHLAACPRCRTAVASIARALADPPVRREMARVAGGWRRYSRIAAIALPAAAALVLIVAWPRAPEEGESIHRAPTITTAPAPVPASPVGVVSDVRALQWAAVPGADRYRVTLFDTEGRVRYEADVAGTSAALPDSVVLVPGARYLWKVEARTGFDRWTSSELVEFSIARGEPR